MSVFKHPKSPFYQIEFHIDGHPFRGSSKTRNKKEAEAVERQWRHKASAEIEVKKRTGNAPMTLSIASGRYMTEVMPGKSSEGDSYRALHRLIKAIGGQTLMSDITDSHVAAYIATRRKQTRWGRKEFKDGSPVGKVSGATINREVAVLKRLFFRSRRTWKIALPNEPDWRGHIQAEELERVSEFSDAQTDALYATVRPDYLPWFEFAHVSGLRLSETILRWTSVNWTTGQIRTKGKGNKWVVTHISPTIREVLEPLIGHHPDYVFTYVAKRTCKHTGKIRGQRYPLTYEGIQSHWGRLKKVEGLHGVRIHDIRHDAASKIVRATGNLKIAKTLLNHSSIAVTDRYAHVLPDEVVAGMEAVAKSRKISRNAKADAA
ncbi:tyrosine-type recombinase/integrase [Mesorhizobium sp. SB112]|uniref:tyrosine-type recombinase/integrase n=1 Tax=Mesorhizobium sp. SB112 TaxID=3151853 RepID=UPI003266A376